MKTRQLVLGLIGAIGAALFASFFALTLRTPEWLESYGATFIEAEAAKQINRQIDALQPPAGSSALARAAAGLYQQQEQQITAYKEALRQQVHERMADAIAKARDLDCECREKWARWLKEGYEHQIGLLQQSSAALTDFIQTGYARVVDQLRRDVRVFTGANAAMFLLILVVTFAKPQASLQLFVPSLLLAVATLICSYGYVFEQNWLLTISYNDYLGYGYLAYLGVVFATLCDIVLNRARITTRIANALLQAAGSAVTTVPC